MGEYFLDNQPGGGHTHYHYVLAISPTSHVSVISCFLTFYHRNQSLLLEILNFFIATYFVLSCTYIYIHRVQSGNSTFVRFVNMLINDATFLLDESLDTLKAIHDTQVAMKDVVSWNAQPQVCTSQNKLIYSNI